MPTLYNQYIYRNGAWRQTGTSSDSVTYQISLSGDTLTLTGSDGSTSSVSISGGGNSEIFIAHYNETTYTELVDAYEDGKALFAKFHERIYVLNVYDAAYSVFAFLSPTIGVDALDVTCTGTYGEDDTSWTNFTYEGSLGNINSYGDINTSTTNPTTIASGDRLVINDESDSKLNNSSITFGTDSTQYLANNGTWQNIPTAPVTSVNSKTGAVNLTASDVGALPSSTTIPSATSDLTNDSNFVADVNYVHTDNNFTDALETKLNGIAAGATVDDHKWNDVVLNKTAFTDDSDYYIPSLLGTSATSAGLLKVNQGAVNQSIPRRTSDGFIVSKTPTAGDNTTKVATTAFVKSAVDTAISGVNSFEYEVVQSLPTTNIKDHTIYLVPKTGTTGDVYDEYLRINNAWEHIGSTDVDLSGYVPTSRTVNGKALSSNISLTASDVGALPDSTTIPAQTAKIWTGTCNTGSGTVVKVITLDDATGFSLTNGIKIAVTFGSEHGLSDIKLNVNNTGEKNVYIRTDASTISSDTNKINWGAGSTVFFTYYSGGSYWFFEGSGRLQGKTYELASSALPKSGGTMTGALTLSGAPTANLHAATKEYVDDTASTKVPKSYSTYGGSVGVDLTSSHKTKSNTGTGYFKIYTFDENNSTNTFEIDSTSTTIHKVVTPTEDGDAVNKKYVDDAVAGVDALPSQSGNNGKFLTTNGTSASWADTPTELFECTYGVTTYSEIATIMNKKLPYLLKYSNNIRKCYIYSGGVYSDYSYHYFDNVSNGVLSRIVCDDMNDWSEETAITVVPTTCTVNGKALSSNITLTASDVGALPSSTTIPAQISKIYTGTCNTAASTATKTVTLDDSTGFSLTAGVRVAVTFTNGNSTATPALNVNSTGVYTIAISSGQSSYKTGDGTTYNGWGAYETLIFTYTGTYWVHDPSGRLSNLSYNLANSALPKSDTGGGGAYGVTLSVNSGAAGNVSDGYFYIYAWSDGNDSNRFQVDSTSTAIHKVVTPTADGDAANKKYVDDGLGTKQKQITVSTSEPTSSDGVDGDIWFVYEE